MSLILVYFILLNGRTTEREGEDMRGSEGHIWTLGYTWGVLYLYSKQARTFLMLPCSIEVIKRELVA